MRGNGDPVPGSLRRPQIEPNDHALTVLADFGETEGGWGPLALGGAPFLYTGPEEERVVGFLTDAAGEYTQRTGRATRVVRFTHREDLVCHEVA